MPKETQNAVAGIWKPDRQCTCKVTRMHVCATIVAVEKQ